ncbi:hypothetical protein [Gryllotalpicola protaetiae]|uniref:Uncharacterized protein n=1 Tax=Gryllotalpicola protaetiae TaxID=2419771 RepID=A0A387BEN2_9MICO|nr:hypothetical protein [Gryllotalpicola protaetiae]AYG02363.1 hypothetical protein D7I44_01655 [Gryllotalpicola protaetiae]
MTTTGQVVAGMGDAPGSRVGRGTCQSVNWAAGAAVVNFAGKNVAMPMVGTAPVPGQECMVGLWAGHPVCLGPLAHPSLGVVAGAPSNGRIPITGDDGVTYLAAYDPNVASWTAGQRVALMWAGGAGGGPVVAVKLSADPAPPPVDPGPPDIGGGAATRDLFFDAAWSGSQNGSGNTGNGNFWTDLVYAGSSTLGGYGYGTAIGDTIPDGASIQQVEIFLDARQALYSGPNIGLHTLINRQGVLTVDQAVTVALGSGWRGLPAGFGDQLKTGARRGIGFAHGGYSIFNPAGVNQSGRLHVRATW